MDRLMFGNEVVAANVAVAKEVRVKIAGDKTESVKEVSTTITTSTDANATSDAIVVEEAPMEEVVTDETAVDEVVTDEGVVGETVVEGEVLTTEEVVGEPAVLEGAAGEGINQEGQMTTETGTIVDPGFDTGMADTKDPLLSSWLFVIGISIAVLFVSVALGVFLAKRKIKKGIELYED